MSSLIAGQGNCLCGAEQFIFDHQVFIEEKPEYYCFSNETQNMTGAEVFAMFAPSSDSQE
jgi:hypothetical protein